MVRNVTDETLKRHAFSVGEVASQYGVSKGLVRLEIARGRLRSVRVGRRLLIPTRAIEQLLNASSRHADS
jgi:excisionase family DNA binding protein